jgi:uncharacterized membrane protein
MQVWNKLFTRDKDSIRSTQWTFWVVLLAAIGGLVASFVLTIEEFHLLQHPNAILSCSFNIVLNCATVMKTWQSHVFGFPNMLIGLIAYPAAISLSMFGLSGVKIPRKLLIAAEAIAVLGALFAYWLFFNSVYVIQVLCPWCLVVTFVTTLIVASITNYNLGQNIFGFSKSTNEKIHTFVKKDYTKLVTASWIVLLIALVIIKFGDSLFA